MAFEVKSELQTAQLAEETALSGTGESADVEAMEVADVVSNMILQIEKYECNESKPPVLNFSTSMTGRKSSCPKSDSTARGGKVYVALKRSHPCGQAPLSVAVARKSSCTDRLLQVSRRRGRPRALRTPAPAPVRTRSRGRPRIRNTFVPVEVPGSDGAFPPPPVLQPYSLKRGPLIRRRSSRRGSVSGFVTSRGRVPSDYFNNDAIAEQFYYDYSCLPGLASRWSFERVNKHSFNVRYIGDSRFVVRNRRSVCSVGQTNLSSLSTELPRYNAASGSGSGSAASSVHCLSFRLPAVLAPRQFVLIREQKLKQLRLLKDWETAMNRICARDGVAQLLVENKVDMTLPPNGFQFVTQSVSEVSVPMLETVPIGCSCKNCLLEWKSCCASQTSIGQFAYDRYRRLKIGNCQPIFECGLLCKCDVSCVNRVVQNGRQYKVCIFRTKNNGWGVKAAEFIPRNAYVMEYVGEIITDAEAERRGAIYDDLGETYLFDLDYLEATKFSIDAKFYGNEARFVNHSCEPNMRVHNVWVNNYHLSLPRLAFFTIRDISPGEELTLNYYMHNDIPSDSNEIAQHMKIIPCLCGSKSCKRTLYVKLHGGSPNKQRMIAEGGAHNSEPSSTFMSKQAEMESTNNKHAVPCDMTQVHN
ncbi:Histone-lysine N-methyltransferase SUV39H1 [Trichinella zimbabwensis]|uniref:Histone-lysine N-methyltransferase SUV39H1 n=1 Tax=Trichinella zimbabwensis TaxID=268475 RepID=A0A0V1H9A4_9BILA|nr:Histone-lysine N-methyltransferase SUV39H1 [Trichinella zimbabwensis]